MIDEVNIVNNWFNLFNLSMMKKRKQTLADQLWMFNGGGSSNNGNSSSNSNSDNNSRQRKSAINHSVDQSQLQIQQSRNSFSVHYLQSLTSASSSSQQLSSSSSLIYPYNSYNISTTIVLDILRVDYNNNICLIKLLKLERIIHDLQVMSNVTIKLISNNNNSSSSSSSSSSSNSRINGNSVGNIKYNRNENGSHNKKQSTVAVAATAAATTAAKQGSS